MGISAGQPNFFLIFDIFDLWFVESADAELMDMKGHLYHVSTDRVVFPLALP